MTISSSQITKKSLLLFLFTLPLTNNSASPIPIKLEKTNYVPLLIMAAIPLGVIGYNLYQRYLEDQKTTETVIEEAEDLLYTLEESQFTKDFFNFSRSDNTNIFLKHEITRSSHDQYPFTDYHKELQNLIQKAEYKIWTLKRRLHILKTVRSNTDFEVIANLRNKIQSYTQKLSGLESVIAQHENYKTEQMILDEKKSD